MNKYHLIIIAVLLLSVVALSFLKINKNQVVDNITTYSSTELGFQFEYPTGPDGYVLDERFPSETRDNNIRIINLVQTKDQENLDAGNVPIGGEGPATITFSIFENVKNQFPLAWAMENIAYSNINLKRGDTLETVVGGANAIRYFADGLYASDNVVVAHGDAIYMLTGMYLEEDSNLRRDFSTIVESITFIPQSSQ